MTALAVERIKARDMEIASHATRDDQGRLLAKKGEAKMKRITVTLSPRFHQWCLENPHETIAIATPPGANTIVMEMEDDAFELFLGRIRKEGGSLAEWLISSDDFVTDITID